MKYSKIKNNGQYNGVFITDYERDNYETAGFQIWDSKNISLTNNIFSGFDPKGLMCLMINQADDVQALIMLLGIQ